MGFIDKYPYTDFHELNLDWILSTIRNLKLQMDEFEVLNKMTFGGAWSIDRQYAAWTIVTNNNIGYVSIRPVPAGVLIGNATYWTQILDYTVSESKRRYILISDSYGEVPSPWTEQFKAKLGLADDDCYINAVGGYGFQPPYNAYFLTLITNLESSVINPNTITDIIVVGGFNDRSTAVSDLHTAIKQFVDYCNLHYPNAKVWIGGAGWGFNYEFAVELENGNYLTAYKECEKDGAHYLNGIDYIMHDRALFREEDTALSLFLVKQYVHPTVEASEMIADAVIGNLNGVGYTVHSKGEATITPATNVTTMTGSGKIFMMQDDESIVCTFDKMYFYFSTAEACNLGEAYIELGTIADGKVGGATGTNVKTIGGPAQGFAVDGNGNNCVPIRLIVTNNRLYANVSLASSITVLAISSGQIRIPITMA